MLKSFFNKLKYKIKYKLAYSFKGSDKDYLINLGKISLGYEMNLDNPQTFNEWINWYKLNYKSDLMPICVDKVRVDEYLEDKGLDKKYLIKKYAIWDSPKEMNLDNLPNEFVIKTNHDSGGVVVCKDKNKFDKKQLKKIKKSFSKTFIKGREWPYQYVHKKIFAEELIKTKDGHSPRDYKFFCFNGKVKFLFVATERDTNTKFDFFDVNWNWINVRQGHDNNVNVPQKPDNFDEMIRICEKISKDFPHVRVDLYDEDGVVKFGELTFYHWSGLRPFDPTDYDYKFGKYFKEIIKKNQFN